MERPIRWEKVPMVVLGNGVYAFAVAAFLVPNGLITGGSTGLALFFHHLFGIPISGFVGMFNVMMFLLGVAFLGKNFALTTLVSTISYPLILSVFQRFPQLAGLTDNPLLAAVYAGGLIGIGIGLVLREGASTGGMDIPPLILNKKFGVSISVMLYLFDCGILLLQVLRSSSEQVLYGILVVLIYTAVLDKVLLLGKGQTQVKIVSRKYAEINSAIQNTLDRGSTLVETVGGRMKEDQYMILSVIANRELPRLNRLVMDIDPKAFLIINQVNEVHGRGFTMEKKYRNQEEDEESRGGSS